MKFAFPKWLPFPQTLIYKCQKCLVGKISRLALDLIYCSKFIYCQIQFWDLHSQANYYCGNGCCFECTFQTSKSVWITVASIRALLWWDSLMLNTFFQPCTLWKMKDLRCHFQHRTWTGNGLALIMDILYSGCMHLLKCVLYGGWQKSVIYVFIRNLFC